MWRKGWFITCFFSDTSLVHFFYLWLCSKLDWEFHLTEMWGFVLAHLKCFLLCVFCVVGGGGFFSLMQISFLNGVSAAVLAWICIKYIGHYSIVLTQQIKLWNKDIWGNWVIIITLKQKDLRFRAASASVQVKPLSLEWEICGKCLTAQCSCLVS